MNSLVKSKIYLAELGFFPQHSGFGYIAYAVTLLREDPMSFYCGSMNIWGGTMMVNTARAKKKLRPGNLSRAKE